MLRTLQCGSVGRRVVAASKASLVASLLTSLVAAAGCDGLRGDIVSEGETVVDILLDVPHSLIVGQRAQAKAQLIGANGRIIESSRVRAVFSSRNVAVATVESTTGTLVGVSPGKAAIVAEARGTVVVDTIEVVAR